MTQWYTKIIIIIWWENNDARGVTKVGQKTHMEEILGKISVLGEKVGFWATYSLGPYKWLIALHDISTKWLIVPRNKIRLICTYL